MPSARRNEESLTVNMPSPGADSPRARSTSDAASLIANRIPVAVPPDSLSEAAAVMEWRRPG
ncbi:hypothetical protein HEP81_00094 [Streptomyces griseofuscus]|uniref:Uncharacterized protein n=1 Tax=Streptomyces griseofuscus TaxID=146922 RepID=A0A7H1PQV2_9ACTN|nr:hypothetical protein HEP81_00094 [Streptomyces griseofuscus]